MLILMVTLVLFAATSVATVSYYSANGALYVVSLSLDSTENGNRFDVMYLVYNGNEYVLKSSGWGYLDANSLVDTSTLTCYVFSGMNEYEDGLLLDYAAYLSRLISWLDYIMPNVSPEFSVKSFSHIFLGTIFLIMVLANTVTAIIDFAAQGYSYEILVALVSYAFEAMIYYKLVAYARKVRNGE